MPTQQVKAKNSKHEELFEKAVDLKTSKKFSEAEKILKKIHKEDPKNEMALLALAEIQTETKRYDIALRSMDRALSLNPDNALVWRHMGYIYTFIKVDVLKAYTCLNKSVGINPQDPETYFLLGYLCQIMNQFDDSIELFEIGLELKPEHHEMRSYLGMSYLRQRYFDKAQICIFEALRQKPGNVNIVTNAMRANTLLPMTKENKQLFHETIDKHRKSKAMETQILIYDLQDNIKKKNYDEALRLIEKMDDNPDSRGPHKYYKKATVLKALKKDEEAFAAYKTANKLQGMSKNARRYKKQALLDALSLNMAHITQEHIEKIKLNTYKADIARPYQDPVFLVGFPRSGTTMSGTILDTHPDILTADEYGAIEQIKIHASQKYGLKLPHDLGALNKEQLQFMHDMYNTKQSSLPLQNKDKIFVDKMPLNMGNMIYIYTLFPNAKILYAKRHPLDSILSGFMQNFAMNGAMVHFNDIEDMARLYKKIVECWEHSVKYIPLQYHSYKYEDVVSDFDQEVTKILDFLGVGWDESVRDFHKGDQTAGPKTLTPSRDQVSKGLYKTAQNRWKKYEEHLKPAIDILGDTIEKLGYEV